MIYLQWRRRSLKIRCQCLVEIWQVSLLVPMVVATLPVQDYIQSRKPLAKAHSRLNKGFPHGTNNVSAMCKVILHSWKSEEQRKVQKTPSFTWGLCPRIKWRKGERQSGKYGGREREREWGREGDSVCCVYLGFASMTPCNKNTHTTGYNLLAIRKTSQWKQVITKGKVPDFCNLAHLIQQSIAIQP